MGNPSGKFVLGFLGGGEVHRENAFALLKDFIGAYLKNNKGAEVTIMVTIDAPFSDTMADLADYCLTNGYKLGLVGHSESFEQPTVKPLMRHASGNLYKLNADQPSYSGLVNIIGVWKQDARLILLADPNEDDYAYHATLAANGKNIPVRSLLTGLEMVAFKDEEETPDMARTDDDIEEEYEDDDLEDLDDEDLEDEEDSDEEDGVEDEEDEDVADDPEEDEDDEEESEEEDDDPDTEEEEDEDEEEDEPDSDEEEDEEEPDDEDDTEDAELDEEDDVESDDEDEDEEDDEESPDDEEEEEEPVARAPKKKAGTPRLTEARLTRMANNDREAFYELAAEHDVYPGRGIKIPTMIARILDPAGSGAAPKKKAAAPVKKATKATKATKSTTKKRSSTRTSAPAPRPTKSTKKTVGKIAAAKASTKKTSTTTRRSTSQQAKAEAFIELAQTALELAQTLL